ncbi:hypothetical protein J3R30DRAFT_3304544 [Lentinula aciculospora]|uniref:Integral membrane protein n=1 Tax=Lentinula aciculospora TaxID=153920 RepID=A0A9W9DGW6_9AGAR|nr:hypothetical protein J3R30DRAFT_3304544 [Lentinula aciculospora]
MATSAAVEDSEYRWHYNLEATLFSHSHNNAFPSRLGQFLHPTRATLALKDRTRDEEFLWKSRDHRKNRHVKYTPKQDRSRRGKNPLVGIGHMTRLEYWNVSWWVATTFTLGSIIWVVNGFYSFLPFVDTSFGTSISGIGWSAWTGATIFEVGSILGVLEAWNRGETASFGWGIRHALGYENIIQPNGNGVDSIALGSEGKEGNLKDRHKWIWFPSDPKYWHELGFLAAFTQFWAATIFWISGFTALPSIQDSITTRKGVLDGVFWTPQVVGGTGFIISSSLLLLETQRRWYLPNPESLGWQIGIWNFIGAIGFTLCGALGYAAQASTKAAYQSSLSTFWGGWAFLIGSVLQWYESVNSV